MSELKISGVITHIGETVQASATFQKRDFVIEVESGQYKNIVAFQLVQDKCKLGDMYTEGWEVEVYFNLRSNESRDGGKWFTNATIWKIDGQPQAQAPATPAPLPQKQKAFTPPAPQQQYTAPVEEEDDVPF